MEAALTSEGTWLGDSRRGAGWDSQSTAWSLRKRAEQEQHVTQKPRQFIMRGFRSLTLTAVRGDQHRGVRMMALETLENEAVLRSHLFKKFLYLELKFFPQITPFPKT